MIPAVSPDLDLKDLAAIYGLVNRSQDFENKLNRFFKRKYSLTYSSGSAGLYHILKSHKIKNKKILISAYTCCVMTEAIVKSGNQPIFIDTAKDSFNAKITQQIINQNQKDLGAVVVTNLFGITDFSDLPWFKQKRKFLLILDNALSPDNLYKIQPTFNYYLLSCNVRKPFSCLGGGLILTNNPKNYQLLRQYTLKHRLSLSLAKKISKFFLANLLFFSFNPLIYPLVSFIRRHTKLVHSFFNEAEHDILKNRPDYFEDMMAWQKRLGINQLKKLKYQLRKRRQIGNLYYHLLKKHFPIVKQYWRLNTPYSHMPFLTPQRHALKKLLLNNKIDTEQYFDYAIPRINQYAIKKKFPRAEKLARNILNLPVYPKLKASTVKQIAKIAIN